MTRVAASALRFATPAIHCSSPKSSIMKLLTLRTSYLLATVSLALPASAQSLPGTPVQPELAQGLFSNLAVGMTLKDGQDSALRVRAPGANNGIPVEWSDATFGSATADHPDFSFQALTRWAPVGMTPEFGGISTGGDIMPPVDSQGRMQMAPGLWCMVSVVLDSQAIGTSGSLLKSRVQRGKNPATEIMSYYVEGSTGIHPRLVDTVRIEYTDVQLNLQLAQPQPAGSREIVNHDFAMGVHSSNSTGQSDPMFPIWDRFYFTLTKPYAERLAASSINLGGQAPSASNVYLILWDASQLEWTAPTIAFQHNELFPAHAVGTVEIDALSVFVHHSGQSRVVISLTPESDVWPNSVFDQLLVYQRNASSTMCPTTALKTPAGMTITQKKGLRPRTGPGSTPTTGAPDNVNSACIGDPYELIARSRRMGTATDELRQGDGQLGFTAVRHSPPNSAMDELHVQVTGLDIEDMSQGVVWLHQEGPVGSSSAPVPFGAPILIDAASMSRNAVDLMYSVPRTIGPTPLRFSAQLWGADLSGTPSYKLLRESWVLSVHL